MDLNQRIQQADLSVDQQNLIHRITSRLHKTAFLSGPELAETCSTSASAITRLSQKLGYSGFPAMKRELEELYRKTTTPYEAFESFLQDPSKDSVMSKSLSQDLENIRRMHANLSEEQIAESVQWMARAKTVVLVGVGSAEALVELAAAYLDALELNTTKLKGFGASKQFELVELDKDDLVIGISFQRIIREVRDILVQAKTKDCRTIAITDSAANPLAQAAEKSLVTPVTGTTFGLSLTAPLAMINLLANSLAANNPKRSLKSLMKAKEQWERYPIFCNE